jgi:kumamolisin
MQNRFNPTALPGSEPKPIRGEASYSVGALAPIGVTWLLGPLATKAQFEQISVFAAAHCLAVTNTDERKRAVTLLGPPDDMANAFRVHLSHVIDPRTKHQIRLQTGQIHVPSSLAPHTVAVLGLDKRPIAHPRFRILPKEARNRSSKAQPLTVKQVMDLYGFPARLDGTGATVAITNSKAQLSAVRQILDLYGSPAGLDGTGVTVAIIELGGGYTDPDLDQFFSGAGVKRPTILAKSVDGAVNSPGSDADEEVLLDVEILGAVAPGCTIVVYFAPNTEQGYVNAVLQVAEDAIAPGKIDKPQSLSMSWGNAEDQWTPMALGAMNAALKMAAKKGVSNFAAAGDNGSSDGEATGIRVDFPASSEYVVACGGTQLIGSETIIISETVWNGGAEDGATGGGVSNVFGLPAYQHGHNVPLSPTGFLGRGVPDVSANADPASGYLVVVDGEQVAIGGTSAVAPLLAGYTALLIQKNGGKSFGNLNSHLYRITDKVFRDIVSGGNGSYKAAEHWDPCSGLGSINGTALLNALAPPVAPTPAAKPAIKSAPKEIL